MCLKYTESQEYFASEFFLCLLIAKSYSVVWKTKSGPSVNKLITEKISIIPNNNCIVFCECAVFCIFYLDVILATIL